MIELGIYVAGPLYSSGDLVTNMRAAIDAAQALEHAALPGVIFRPFVPHINVSTWQLVYARGHQLAQDWDDFWLLKCDAVFRLPGHSVGSDHECLKVAPRANIPVFHSLSELRVWATDRYRANLVG